VLETKAPKVEDLEVEELYTAEEAAEYLQYHPEYVRRLARNGELKGLRRKRRGGRGKGRGGPGEWRFRKEDLDAIRRRIYDPAEEVNA